VREEYIGGIHVNGMLVQMLRFANDIAAIEKSEEDLAYMLENMIGT